MAITQKTIAILIREPEVISFTTNTGLSYEPWCGWQDFTEVIAALGKLKYFVPLRNRPEVRPAGRPAYKET